ncbi:MAG TPA: hypothetical protein VK447_01450 [Myxococcaceae bacterium]|nr:hypothetical protein [Myxococcaceae bacterium]
MKSSRWLVLLTLVVSSVVFAQTPPLSPPPDVPADAPAPPPAAAPSGTAKAGEANAPSVSDYGNRWGFLLLGSALGAAGGGIGGFFAGRAIGGGGETSGFGYYFGGVVGMTLGGTLGAGIATILVGTLLPGEGNKLGGALGALVATGIGVLAVQTVVLLYGWTPLGVTTAVSLIIPVVLSVWGYESWYRSPPPNAGDAETSRVPAPMVVPFAGLFPDGSGGRVGLMGTF